MLIVCSTILLPVTVEDHLGRPAIHVDGQPVAPLMFFGIPQGTPVKTVEVGPEWREFHLTFVPDEDNMGMGGIQVRFGGGPPGTVWVDDCRVYPGEYHDEPHANMVTLGGFEATDEEVARYWSLWTSPVEGADASLAVDTTDPAEGERCLKVDLRVAGSHPMHVHLIHAGMTYQKGSPYTYSVWLRSSEVRTVEFFALRQGGSFRIYEERGVAPYSSQVALAAGAGVHIHSFTMPMPWPRPGEDYEWTGVDTAVDRTIASDPEALLLPRFGMEPPEWWYEQHPGSEQVFSDGSSEGCSMASEEWRSEAETHLRALVRYCEEKYGDHMLGYHPCGQNTGEWFYRRSWDRVFGDYSPAMLDGFRRYLAERYGDAVDPETVTIPTEEQLLSAAAGWFHDPVAEARLLDYLRYEQIAMVEPLERFARAIKEETNGERLVTFFYGYTFELCGLPWGPAKGGHYALERLLRCPDVDILCSPISYQDRQLGGAGDFMTAIDSIHAAGKLWLVEDDTRTHLTAEGEGFEGGSTLQETQWIHTRQFGHLLPRRLATWYMDLGATGWLNDPGIWSNLARLREQYERALGEPPTWSPDVAVIVDEEGALYGRADWALHRSLVYETRIALARAGAPQRWHLLSDLVAGRVPKCQAYVMLNCFHLDGEERAAIARETAGSAAIWFYGGGFLDDGPAQPAAPGEVQATMADATGLPIIAGEPRKAGDPLSPVTWFDGDPLLEPFWTVREDQGVEVLTRLADGTPGIALAETDAVLRAYVAPLGCTSADFRKLFLRAGAHVYCESDDVVLTDDRFLCVSATSAGVKAIHLRRPATVTDAVTGEVVAAEASSFSLSMELGEARVLWLD